MINNSVFWGIIGCGDVTEVKSGPAFQKCAHSSLLAVMRRNATKAEDYAKRHQVKLWHTNASDLLNNKNINAIYIATPPSSHLEYAIKALQSGKDVYLEKPMVLNKEQALLLKEEVEKSSNKLVVAHYRRYLPMYIKIKELLESDAIGKIKYVDLKYFKNHKTSTNKYWRLDPKISGGGYFHDLAPHQLDLMYYFFGDFDAAKGFSSNQEGKYKVSDTVNGIINFKSGVQFRGIWSFDVPDYLEEDSCTIFGSLGKISLSLFGNDLKLTINNETSTFSFSHPKNIQQPFIQETINYFLEKRSNPCSVKDGLAVATIMDAFTTNTF